ncbi:hypothetical protein AKJ51_03095 [candidate division MSBL1 archaeon SCGC-AAA382A20]|uniref:CBM-cenC domain-containing protein n=1 Tax=candidate division MSBL1 archaeon SCGC-AAA382A20 TaxID=1698280 RepID=A0A133VJU8_9EURY|nr:hypothetical protein AKJ51_03095 [candidate division MSBL1 archaeon SCGC-AAA382A20]
MKKRKIIVFILILASIVTFGILITQIKKSKPPMKKERYHFSFEKGMDNWKVNGTDLDNPPVEWDITRTKEMATDGSASLKFYLANVNDAGKIWIERTFELDPSKVYDIRVSYDFASADFGDLNLWRIITGVSPEPPLSDQKTPLVFQGNTGNRANSDIGFKWLEKSYKFKTQTDAEGKIYVNIGIWGTWETTRKYYFDNILIEYKPT